jgi:hypothetical protein
VTAPALTFTALREYRRRVAAMLDDPECGGELFSLGVALLDFAVLKTSDDKTWKHYADRAWGNSPYGRWQIRDVLRKDIRRYDAIADAESSGPRRACGAPMIRRQGPCGKSASIQTMLTDVDTGRRQWIAACARHREWFDARTFANRQAVDTAEKVVVPAANAGGVLARHIPEIDWPALWVTLQPGWTPPPESEPEEVHLKPRLRLVLGGA